MVTVKIWKQLNTFDPMANGKFDVDGTVALVAVAQGKTVEDVEEMPVDELLPTFLQCVHDANALVFSKLPKNGSGDDVK